MKALFERLAIIDNEISHAVKAVETDAGSSPVLDAVVKEFKNKSNKTLDSLNTADAWGIREAIVELEQAADSAKVAVEADAGATERARKAVLDAHMSICIVKNETVSIPKNAR